MHGSGALASPFDVVVVGGGAAGCVAAARLVESGAGSVLLLEAGPDRRADLPDEIRDGWGIAREQFDWGYRSEPDDRGVVRNLWRGRLLGGTSWLTRFTPRGSPADYDGWVALGNPGWGWVEVLPFFKRLERDTDFGDRPWHGDRGPLPSTRYLDLEHTPVVAAAVQALEAAGVPAVEDHNRPGAVGVGRMPMSSRNGRRVTTADVYLPATSGPSFTIHADALVERVLFDGSTARGVRLADGTEVEAGRVVLCAGTYGSPVILMRSGIGPAQQLRDVGVRPWLDLPGVGANLADHPAVAVDCGPVGGGRTAPILHSIATFHSAGRSTTETPDLMFWLADPAEPPGQPGSFEIEVVLLRPRSRGTVRLRSADPAAPPVIDLPGLTDPTDAERLGEGYRRALDLAGHPELRRLCSGALPNEPDDRELHRRIRAEAYSLPHVVGTCAMGPRPDAGAVVDAQGRVHGTTRLFVVDASIMPDVPSGFTHIPTIMLAERLAKQIAAPL